MDKQQRNQANCGFIPLRSRSGRALIPPNYPYERPSVCGGYLVSMPQVIESARAASWRKEGALAQFYDTPLTDLAKFCIDIVAAEFRAVEQALIRGD